MSQNQTEYQYDVFVIGGGSGGLACSKESAMLGRKVALADFVVPNFAGKSWGLGGTCVNVGCVPKKMMHYASEFGEIFEMQKAAGWNVEEHPTHNWEILVNKIQSQLTRLNGIYEDGLKDKKVTYYNAYATLKDAHTVLLKDINGNVSEVTSQYIVFAIGARPRLLEDTPNLRELVITSDELFSKPTPPGKTLIIGGSYVGMECAGLLNGLGYDVTVIQRGTILTNFDQEFVGKIKEYLTKRGVKLLEHTYHNKITKVENSHQKEVVICSEKNGICFSNDTYDTVLLAIGRKVQTKGMGLEDIGIKLNPDGQIICKENDQTDVPNIFAVGDCVSSRIQLTPLAVKCGRLLAQRLFNNSTKLMSYDKFPTTVFTPIEYGMIGFSEEGAIQKYGKENINVWFSQFKPSDWAYSKAKANDRALCKLITLKTDSDRVIGFHYLGPQAAEVTQGYQVAINMNATKKDFDNAIAIHPSYSEEFTFLREPRS